MGIEFKPAERRKRKLRMAIDGPSGSGKSVSGLGILRGVVGPDGRIAVVDTEKESILEYAGVFPGTRQPTGFDMVALNDCSAEAYIEAITAAAAAGYDGLLIDSVSHEWAGKNGILEFVDTQAGEDAFFSKKGWRKATPKHTRFIEAVIGAPLHVIVTMRVKSDYVIEKDENGKNAPRKIGLQPIQREGFDYEFSILGSMDNTHTLQVTKARTLDPGEGDELNSWLEGAVIVKPGLKLGRQMSEWLNAPPGEWLPPEFSRSFVVNDKTIISGGISRETYVACLNTGAKVDKKHGGGTSRALLTSMYQKASTAALTEPEGVNMLAALNERLALSATPTPAEAK